jgi:hypothetical protein
MAGIGASRPFPGAPAKVAWPSGKQPLSLIAEPDPPVTMSRLLSSALLDGRVWNAAGILVHDCLANRGSEAREATSAASRN